MFVYPARLLWKIKINSWRAVTEKKWINRCQKCQLVWLRFILPLFQFEFNDGLSILKNDTNTLFGCIASAVLLGTFEFSSQLSLPAPSYFFYLITLRLGTLGSFHSTNAYQSRSQSFVPLDQWSENESSGSIHFEITMEITEFCTSGFTAQCAVCIYGIYGACL